MNTREHKGEWFASTHWSVVLTARNGEAPRAGEALEQLCRTYWPPLYAFIRREGHDENEAKDLTQEFFLKLIERNYLQHLKHQRGRFRSFMLLILNLPLVPLFAQLLRLPYYVLYPIIIGISIVGVYSVNQSLFDVWLMGIFGLLGYFMRTLDFPVAPLVLGMVLGTPWERALRQSLIMSQGSLTIFLNRPISLILLLLSILVIAIPVLQALRSPEPTAPRGESNLS